MNKQKGRKTRQTYKRQTGKLNDRRTDKPDRQDRQADRQTDRQDKQTNNKLDGKLARDSQTVGHYKYVILI